MWFPLKRAGARSYTKDLYYLMRAPLEELNCKLFEPYPIKHLETDAFNCCFFSLSFQWIKLQTLN